MKRFAIFFLTILMLVVLAACDEEVCQHRDADDNSLCDKCGESYTDGIDVTPEHTHAFGAWEQTVAPTCQAKGEEKRSCSCGEIEKREVAINESAHTFGVWSEIQVPTCQTKGVEKRSCACGVYETRETVKDANNHVAWGDWGVTTPATCQATGVDTRTCACGHSETRDSAKDMTNHVAWGDWGVTTPATCQAKGVDTRTCACGHSETRDSAKDMTNHVAWGDWGVTTPATCQAKGVDTRTCACGHSETRDSAKNMDNHTAWGDWIETTKPTCQAKGVDTRTCACGHSETRDSEKDMTNHVAWGDWIETTKPTCQATGVDTRTCACGHSETRDSEKDMTNHVAWGDWIETTKPTCQAKGEETRTCACGEEETRDVAKDMTNHVAWGNWIEITKPTCQAKGEETRTCACGAEETRDVAKDMSNHVAWGNWIETTKPTCQAKGEETRTCACGAEETRDVAKDMSNHVAWGEWIETTKPTCQAKGEETRTCACGAEETRDVAKDMSNHVAWGNWIETTTPTCQAKGVEMRTCACGHSETRDVAINPNAHSFASELSYSATHHYYACSCGAQKNSAKHISSGAATATQDEVCTVCGYVINPAVGIQFKTLTVEGNIVHGKVPNTTTQFSFINEITMVGGAKYAVLLHVNDNNPVLSKTIDLAIGDNTVYIIELIDDEPTNVYTVTIRRRPVYEISFVANGNVFASDTIEEQSFLSAPDSVPQKTGYHFVGWSLTNGGTETVTMPYQVHEDTAFYAVFVPNTYHYTYNVNGGDALESVEGDALFNGKFTLATPTRTGYTFKGWRDAKGTVRTASFTWTYTEDMTFTAVWQANTYTVTYDYAGGSHTSGTKQTVTFDAAYTLREPTRVGYAFKGYTLDGEIFVKGDTYTYPNGITLVAQWEIIVYNLTTHEDAATTKANNVTTYTVEDAITLKSPEKVGYTFTGWYTAETGGSKVTEIAKGSTGDVVLYARFTPNTYTITYNYAGGSHTSGTKQTVTFDAAYTLCEPTRAGYTFKGYALDGKEFVKGETYTYPNSITLVAQWEIIVYDLTTNEDEATTKANNVTTYTVEDAIALKSPEKVGYTFTGWYTAETGGSKVTEIAKGSTGDVVLYARFTPNTYTITYDYAGGSHASGTEQSVTFDGEYTLREPTRNGCTFVGYTLDGNAFAKEEIYTYPNSITLVAQWEAITYTITYDVNGGVPVSGNPVTYTTLSTEQLIALPDREYYTFLGWYSGSQKVEKLTGLYGDLALVAKWGAHFTLSGNTLTKFTDYGKNYNYATLIIPSKFEGVSITAIGDSAFKDCTGLTSITVPSSVTNIGSSAFKGCTGLTSITLPFVGADATASGYQLHFGYIFGYKSTSSSNSGYHYYDSSQSTYKYFTYYIPTSLKEVVITSGTSIGNYAFRGCTGLTSITIPSSVTSFGEYAFYNCTGLTSITIPSSVTSIGEYAFYNCTGLTSITFGENGQLTSIGNYAFRGCMGLTSITIPSSVTSIGEGAFYNCTGLTSITIPSSVTSIGEEAFYNCTGLTSITVPSSVTNIGSSAFKGCTGLTSITIPSSVTSIGYAAFNGCSGLTSMTLPFVGGSVKTSSSTYQYPFGYIFGTSSYTGGVETCQQYYGSNTSSTTSSTYYIPASLKSVTITGGNILRGAFYNCTRLTSITIPSSVTSFGEYAFSYCTGLTSITFGENSQLTSIGMYAFRGCTGLTSITIPSSVTSIGYSAFSYCSGLTSITLPFVGTTLNGSNNHFGYIFGASWYSNNGNYVPAALKTVVITGGTSIGFYAFYNCSGLTSITIPSSVTRIGSYAFYNCSGLMSITIPSSVTSIVDYAFEGCYKLAEVINHSSLNITAGESSCGAVGYYAKEVHTGESKIVNIDDYLFYTYDDVNYLLDYVGDDLELVLPNDYCGVNYEIYKYAFRGCTGLTSITIPDSVTSIGDSAFRGCTGLTSITIPDSVTSIGDSVFRGCTSLTSVTIPSRVTSIGSDAFSGCTGLTSITFAEGSKLTSIGSYAFYGCTGLQKVYYGGTASQWSNISIGSSNSKLTSATRYYYSAEAPTTTGKYWHYDENGNVVEW